MIATKLLAFFLASFASLTAAIHCPGTRFKELPFCKKPTVHDAVAQQNTALLTTLINEGSALDDKDEEKFTPLQRAAQKGHQGCINLLIEAGANQAMLITIRSEISKIVLEMIIEAARKLYVQRNVQLKTQEDLISAQFTEFDSPIAHIKPLITLINAYISISVPSKPSHTHFDGSDKI